jgi:hypothetical protein
VGYCSLFVVYPSLHVFRSSKKATSPAWPILTINKKPKTNNEKRTYESYLEQHRRSGE